jgi:hypothetical protein
MKIKLTILLGLVAIASSVLLGQSFNNIWLGQSKIELIQKELKDGKLYLGWRSETDPGVRYPEGGGPPNIIKAWREVYGVSNGIVVLERKEDGAVTPASTKAETTPEKIEWPK